MARKSSNGSGVKRGDKARADLDLMLAWYEEHEPAFKGEIHVSLGDDTLRQFATKLTDKDGTALPHLWSYKGRTLRQHHAVKPRKGARA